MGLARAQGECDQLLKADAAKQDILILDSSEDNLRETVFREF